MRSTIYCSCPGCHENTLVQETGGTWRCAVCSFDYATLARDDAAREAWMLDNLQRGPMGQLAVIHLHRVVRAMPLQASNAAVVAFAARHGIALPTGRPTSPAVIAGAIVAALVVLFAGVYLAFVR